jgi:predicted DNA-binding antitoxin AbrB/MazE fold protein
MTIRAVYENGVFRPTEKVDLPDKAEVLFEPRIVRTENAPTPAMAKIYEILSRTYDTGQPDLAERHDQHQP